MMIMEEELQRIKENVELLETVVLSQKRGETYEEAFQEKLINTLSGFSDRLLDLEEQVGEDYPIDLNESEAYHDVPFGCRDEDFADWN